MKIICSWCQELIGYKCPFCGGPLRDTDQPKLAGLYMECAADVPATRDPRKHTTKIIFSIEQMRTTHGICLDCEKKARAENRTPRPPQLNQLQIIDAGEREAERELTPEDRANLEAMLKTDPEKGCP